MHRRRGKAARLACALVLASATLFAQAPAGGSAAVRTLLDNAHADEVRNRMDLAADAWRRVLLNDPNNTEALGGLARASKLRGNDMEAQQYLQKLRSINPGDPAINRVESIQAQPQNIERLQVAGRLAQAGRYAEAMAIYRQEFPNGPKSGEWALAYYETEAATEGGRPHAIQGLRSLIAKFPQDTRYQVTLGRILTYDPHTREEGRRLLLAHPHDPSAMDAARQSLGWDSQNPAAISDLRAYLKTHKDPALSAALKTLEAQQARARRSGTARAGAAGNAPYVEPAEVTARRESDAEVAAAYAALNAKRLEEAEARFKTILAKNSDDNRALAGMGYVRMNQSNFGGAISFLEQAKQEGSRDAGVDKGLATSRFWYTMGEGGIALNENDLATAEKDYRTALQMRPGSPEALEGLGGTLMKAQQPAAAIPVFEQYVRLKPASSIAWRGLFMSQYQAGNAAGALNIERRIPGGVRSQLNRDPEFLRTLASAYSAVGRDADAQRVLRSALELPFPEGQGALKTETRLQYAALLQQANRLDQAAGLFREVLAEDSGNVIAWQGLVRVQHAMKADAQAQQTIESMPPSVYDQALRDSGFMTTAAAVYQTQNKLDVAQSLLEKSVASQTTAGQKPPVGTLIQLAGLYVQRGNAQAGYNIYRQVLQEDSTRTDAWKGLVNALHASGHDKEALAQIKQIPPEPMKHLEQDVEYLQTVGGIYNGLGQPREAMIFLNRVQQKYAASHSMPPADIDIQNAWLLFNGSNDTGLYRQLMFLGSRTDLTDEQRRTVQTIWANWSVRRANQLLAQGYAKRPIAILNAAAKAFPDNPGVFKALASGYARAGLPKQAVEIFKAQDLTTASASDYKSAIGAALAANDTKDAETWLRFALDQYPHDSQILTFAAKFEQARGDNGRAADYYRASLAAMPPPDPGAELADELSRPVQSYRPPTVAQQQDLASLLVPGSEPGVGQGAAAAEAPVERPYLPSYGSQYGQPPVVLTPDGQPAGSAIVPSYMTNPAYEQHRIQRGVQRESLPQRRTPSNVRKLGDYLPQSSASPADALPGLDGSPANQASADAAIRSFQMEQIRRATEMAQTSGADLPETLAPESPYSTMASGVNSSGLAPGTVIASSQAPPGDVYGPFVPYTPEGPTKDMAVVPLYSGVVQHVRIPAAMEPAPEGSQIANAETVEQQMKYLPNSRIQHGSSVPPEIAAFDAAEIRRHQSDLNARTISAVPAMSGPMSGQSAPPTEADISVQQSQYVAPGGQVSRPSSLPPMPTTDGAAGNSQRYGGSGYGAYGNGRRSELPYQPSAADRQLTIGQQYPQPRTSQRTPQHATPIRQSHRRAAAPASTAPGPAYAPLYYPAVPSALTAQGYPAIGQPVPLGAPPSDAQLVQRNLPPLRGGWYPEMKESGPPLTEREQTELELATMEASYSGWLGGTASVRFRTGTSGVNRLYDFEAPFEASVVAGKTVRFSVIPKTIFLNSGQLATDPNADLTSGNSYLGSLPLNALNTPSAQYASGVGGEIQMVTQNLGLAVGYTPYEFLVRNITGRFRWRPAGGAFSVFAERDSVRDTQLSYAGLRDPGTVTPVYEGSIWGGVISTGGGVRLDFGDEKSGFYASAAGYALTGYHVLDNRRYEGTAGAYFRVKQFPGVGSLNVGGTFFGMHYDHNERGLTYGQGGYFSPEAYFLAAVPVSFTGSAGDRWHYTASGAVGVQAFQEASAPFYPLDTPLQQGALSGCTLPQIGARTCGYYPVNSNTGLNFDVNGQASYRFYDHWYLGGFFKANNTNNYGTATVGFSVRYMFKKQYANEDYPTGLFPADGFRPLRVP